MLDYDHDLFKELITLDPKGAVTGRYFEGQGWVASENMVEESDMQNKQ